MITSTDFFRECMEDSQSVYNANQRKFIEKAIEFAKLHVKTATETIEKKVKIILNDNGEIKKVQSGKADIESLSETSGVYSFKLDKTSILNAYSLDNIK